MNTYKKNAIVAGVLFIIGTVPAILSSVLLPLPNDLDYLIIFSANENQVILRALLMTLMAFACAGIAISLFPILKKYNEGLALGSVGFRIVEGSLAIICAVILIMQLIISQEFVKAGAPASSYFQTIGAVLMEVRYWVRDVPMLLAWCIGAWMYYYIFYQTKLIPRWLSVWGLVGIALTIISSILVLFHIIGNFSSILGILNIPILLQEMVLAGWLIVKGFNPSALTSLSAKTDMIEVRR